MIKKIFLTIVVLSLQARAMAEGFYIDTKFCTYQERFERGDFRSEYRGAAYLDLFRDREIVASILLYETDETYGGANSVSKSAKEEIEAAIQKFCN